MIRKKSFYTCSIALLVAASLTVTAPLCADGASPDEAAADPEVMAYGRFVPEREDDFTWENDKVAFRIYGPSSSGKGQVSGVDAWLKKVPYSIIDKWYAGHLEGVSYHTDHGEGYDPYHVGDSRGIGGTAIWIEGKPWPAGKYESYEILQSGGEVVEFTVHYEWETPLGKVTETKTISLELGDQLYRVESMFTLNGEPAVVPVAIGLTTHDGAAEASGNPERGGISTWETIDDYGLGTAVLLSPDRVVDVVEVSSENKDESHVWLLTSSDENGELIFSAGFAWEAAGEITSFKEWNKYLNTRVAH